MISKAKSKYIRSLELKKNRTKEGAFVAEGNKVVRDLLGKYSPRMIVAVTNWLKENVLQLPKDCETIEVSEEELRKVSFLQHPQEVLGVFHVSEPAQEWHLDEKELYLALDGVQDPGNVGTIVRIADWFGISTIFCSEDTADVYNPKVVQATMGSLARVNIVYTNLIKFIHSLPTNFPVYGTLLDGKNIYEQEITRNGLIVMGNEGKGISHEIAQLVTKKLLIPHYPEYKETADSLNVAIATAVSCAEFRRRQQF